MQLYDVYKVMMIEHMVSFKEDMRKVLECRNKRIIYKLLKD